MNDTKPSDEAALMEQDTTATSVPVPFKDDEAVEKVPATENTAVPAEPQSVASSLQSLTDKALNFLATASNETLGACLVGLGAATYIVLGRVGLVIIGVAGGVVLQATWDGTRNGSGSDATKPSEAERRREAGVDVVKRVLDWRVSSRAQFHAEDSRVYASQALDYSSFGPEASAALDAFTTAVIKDYVHYWYDATIPGEESFPASCRRTFTAFMLSLSGHLQRKRAADSFLDFVTNASSILIVFLNELTLALNASPNATPEEAISAYLQMKPESSLAYMLDQDSQKAKLADAAEDILQAYLDPKSYNCPPVHSFLKAVLSQLILEYSVTKCSEPAWINDWIVYGLEESETAKEVMEIVDAGVEGRDRVETPKIAEQNVRSSEIASETESASAAAHRRKMSRAEGAMDEAMREAKRLTELMIEEDKLRAQQEKERDSQSTPPNAAGSADASTQGVPTPTSSESDRDHQSEDVGSLAGSSVAGDSKASHASTPSTQFTSFDQIIPKAQPTALSDGHGLDSPARKAPVLTLHNANISIFDDSVPGERASIKAKPNGDLLIQIEPANSAFPGWMIVRKYADFETLHEVMRRISVITGTRFTEAHNELPKWRVHTKASLRTELERYITDAVRFQTLAESEGMKRFLEKDQGLNKSPSGNKGFGWQTPDAFGKLGGDMMNVLTKAPKQVAGGVAGGGKAVFGGVSGLVGAVGNVGKKAGQSSTNLARSTTSPSVDNTPRTAGSSRSSMQLAGQGFMTDSYLGTMDFARESEDSFRATPEPAIERRPSSASLRSIDTRSAAGPPASRPASILSQNDNAQMTTISPAASTTHLPANLQGAPGLDTINLPPPPSEMPSDYGSPVSPSRSRKSTDARSVAHSLSMSQVADPDSILTPATPLRTQVEPSKTDSPAKKEATKKAPLTDRETSVAIELMFAVISELYTLSGAWQIRKTLLTAAKTFLLRPGNPQLGTIRDLLQSSLLDANLSDSGLAHQIYKLRKNTVPTPKELEIWTRDYPKKTAEQKEELRIKARRLLVTKGMPQALTSVMGAAASGEALGKVFDCLQLPGVSRGLIFGLTLQALRIITH
ncbi:Putative Phox-associated domain, sorting nexin, PX domain superfamily [Septoria linicola]|uniref:Phox-associated domain, sorting nexin, PX domain superfamily n=1 Tax=Septoria linicola TaxID=215465 RepID=A0A9Q9B2T5_9PEZI|nr:Putative Phox-associated domain, sorting nexin, PX domain superfamily [Septoria linicola]